VGGWWAARAPAWLAGPLRSVAPASPFAFVWFLTRYSIQRVHRLVVLARAGQHGARARRRPPDRRTTAAEQMGSGREHLSPHDAAGVWRAPPSCRRSTRLTYFCSGPVRPGRVYRRSSVRIFARMEKTICCARTESGTLHHSGTFLFLTSRNKKKGLV